MVAKGAYFACSQCKTKERMPNENKSLKFSDAVDDLNSLVKSRRDNGGASLGQIGESLMGIGKSLLSKARRSQIGEMSDEKDYMEEDIDESDRKKQGKERKDMREANDEWPGIQALDDELSDEGEFEEGDEEHEMLVSGRPSRIRFPGAKGDSELSPVQDVVDIPDREAYDRAGGGDRAAQRSQRRTSMKSKAHERDEGEEEKRHSKHMADLHEDDDGEETEKSFAHHRKMASHHRSLAEAHAKRARHHHEAGSVEKAMQHEHASEHHDGLADQHMDKCRSMARKSQNHEADIYKALAANESYEDVVEASDALAHMTDVFAKSYASMHGRIDSLAGDIGDIKKAVATLCNAQGEVMKSFGKVPTRINDSGIWGQARGMEEFAGNRTKGNTPNGRAKLPNAPIMKGSPQYDMLKSKLQDAMSDEKIDPEVLQVFEAIPEWSNDATPQIVKALSRVPQDVRKAYDLPDWGYAN